MARERSIHTAADGASASLTRGRGGVLGSAALVSVVLAGVAVYATRRPAPLPPTSRRQGTTTALSWCADAAAPPWVGRANDDAVEDVVGLFEDADDQGDDRPLYLGAFDGVTLSPLWRVQAGTHSGAASTHLLVSGRRVVVADALRLVRVHDLSSGRALGQVALADPAEALCADPDEPAHVWVGGKDHGGVLVDAAHASGAPRSRPAWCRVGRADVYCASSVFSRISDESVRSGASPGEISARRIARLSGEAVPGFSGRVDVSDGTTTVLFGGTAPGMSAPMAVALSAADQILWRVRLSNDAVHVHTGALEAAAMGHGVVAGSYRSDDEGSGTLHVVALEVANGRVRWDVPLKTATASRAAWIVLGASRVYVASERALTVLDATTGAALGFIGRP